MVPKGPLKHGNNTETSRINCSNRFEIFSTTDDDDDSKSGKSDNIITEESLTNDDVRKRKNKIQKSCITNKKQNTLSKKNDTQSENNRRENIKAASGTNKITKDHHKNRQNVNRMTSTYSNVVRNKKKNIVLFTDGILKTLW